MRGDVALKIAESANLAIQVDGWSNCRREGILNFIINTPRPIFWTSVPTEDNPHTSENLSKEILKVMRELDPLKTKFYAICTDNAANMKKAAKLVAEEYEDIQIIGCLAHWFHLLVSDLLKQESVQDFMGTVMQLVNKIRNSQVLLSLFNKQRQEQFDKQGDRPVCLKLFVKTRWGSIRDCLKSVLANKKVFESLSIVEAAKKDLGSELRYLILSENFWIKISQLLDFMSPIVSRIISLEADDTTIDMVVTYSKNLTQHYNINLENTFLSREEKEALSVQFHARMKYCVREIHYCAHLLSPLNTETVLTPRELSSTMEFLYKAAKTVPDINPDDVMIQLSNFRNKEDLWKAQYMWNSAKGLKPTLWWKTYGFETSLAKVALKILSMPTTSASTERSFSTHGYVHSKSRNRLSNERAAKLTFIQHNYNLQLEKKNVPRKMVCDNVSNIAPDAHRDASNEENTNVTSDSESSLDDVYSVHDSTESETFSDFEIEEEEIESE